MSEAHHEAPGHHPPEHSGGKEKKKGKKVGGIDQKVLVAAAVATVILTYLLWRRSRSSSASSTDSTTANGLGGQPFSADGGGGGGSSQGSTSSSSGTSSTSGAAPSPIAVVSDKADELIAEANGFLPSQIRYAGSDPNAGNPNAAALGYDAPTDLATYNPATDAGAFDLGLAGNLNNGLQAITGADRTQTAAELQEALGLPVTHSQAAASGTSGVSAPAPPVTGKTTVAGATAKVAAPKPAAPKPAATVAAHPAAKATTAKAHVTTPSPAVQRSSQSQLVNLPGGHKGE